LNILSLIFSQNLERALGGGSGATDDFKLGIPMLLQTGGRWVEASYIEGFGAVFNLKVRFPLVTAATPDKDTQTAQLNSQWEQARQALAGAPAAPHRWSDPSEKTKHYSPQLVETLKKRVLELLKNASNLRHVQPDEWVVVTFTGPPNAFTSRPKAAGIQDPSAPPQAPAGAGTPAAQPSLGSASIPAGGQSGLNSTSGSRSVDRATVMTIRIKKKDADAVASNKITEEQFFHAAEITRYLGPAIVNVNDANSAYMLLQSR
jgi:hypothetical protein